MVIEYNCRMGDPETEVVIPRLKNDLVDLLLKTTRHQLEEVVILIDERTAVTTVAVSGGYPGDYIKGKIINGLTGTETGGGFVFHSGTKLLDGNTVTNGGRVLAVTSFGQNIKEATHKSKEILEKIRFEEMNYRYDIGYEFV